MKKIILGFIFIAAISLVFCNFALAEAEPGPIRPELKLTVEQSPLAIYPPIMIYTAQLSYIPPIYTGQLIADFYNIPDNSSSARIEYLGSAPFDKTGKAVFIKQMNPGLYTGIAKTTINGIVIWSNKVEYRVR